MEFKEIPLKYKVIAGVIAFLFISTLAGGLWINNGLKKDIRQREKRIEQIESEKKPILADIKANEEELKKKDEAILVLSNKQLELETTIKNLKNENNRIKNNYRDSPLDERIRIFAKLAAEKDNL